MFFFLDRSLSRLNFLFSLDFLRNDIFSPHGLYKGGVAGEVRYRVSFRINPCAERAGACQARACIGAEGFIHSEESVPLIFLSPLARSHSPPSALIFIIIITYMREKDTERERERERESARARASVRERETEYFYHHHIIIRSQRE